MLQNIIIWYGISIFCGNFLYVDFGVFFLNFEEWQPQLLGVLEWIKNCHKRDGDEDTIYQTSSSGRIFEDLFGYFFCKKFFLPPFSTSRWLENRGSKKRRFWKVDIFRGKCLKGCIHLEGKMIFQTSMIMFHVNLQGCKVILTQIYPFGHDFFLWCLESFGSFGVSSPQNFLHIPRKFNCSPLKNHGLKMNVLLGIPILRGELLNFRGVCSWSLSFWFRFFEKSKMVWLKKLRKNDAKGWSPKRRYVSIQKILPQNMATTKSGVWNSKILVDTTNGDFKIPSWWFQTSSIFTLSRGRFPFWRIFFRWVGSTTNQQMVTLRSPTRWVHHLLDMNGAWILTQPKNRAGFLAFWRSDMEKSWPAGWSSCWGTPRNPSWASWEGSCAYTLEVSSQELSK